MSSWKWRIPPLSEAHNGIATPWLDGSGFGVHIWLVGLAGEAGGCFADRERRQGFRPDGRPERRQPRIARWRVLRDRGWLWVREINAPARDRGATSSAMIRRNGHCAP